MKEKCFETAILSRRDRCGLWLGKGVRTFSRLGGRDGTTLPGRLAGSLAPGLLRTLAGQVRCNLVLTGSNGKTTTAFLLATLLRRAGIHVVHNHSGANLPWGIAATLIEASSWGGRLAAGASIMEVDEAFFAQIVREVRPRGALVTNICRDQLDRYGEEESIRNMIGNGLALLPAGAKVLLNADDPEVTGLAAVLNAGGAGPALPSETAPARKGPRLFFYGLELARSTTRPAGNTGEFKACPRCGQRLAYSIVYFAHFGHYACTACSFRRPRPQFRLLRCLRTGKDPSILSIATPGEHLHLTFPLPGLFNLYNALAAVACARTFGVAGKVIESGLASVSSPSGRMEQFLLAGRKVTVGLIKNAAGGNAVLRTILETPERLNLLIAINDRYADGTDISWLWDVDFELLAPARERISTLTVGGRRALETAVRLKYAGIEPSFLMVECNPARALEQSLQGPAGEPLFLLLSYTAMQELHRIIRRRNRIPAPRGKQRP